MDAKFVNISVKSLSDNIFKLLDNDWMLVTAGKSNSFNTMTASWGTFGILWNKPIAICFIRPQRYTLEFINLSDSFTLSFFKEEYRDTLNYCGSHSGRTTDKMGGTGLTVINTDHGNIGFLQARLILECRKLYTDQFKSDNFMETSLAKGIYPRSDFHHFFIGEIINCYTSDPVLKENSIPFDESENDTLP